VTGTEKKRSKIDKEQEDANKVRMVSKEVATNIKLEAQEEINKITNKEAVEGGIKKQI
jgi:hypothetical protein